MLRKLASVAVLGTALWACSVGRSSASLITFAQFTENSNTPNNPFTYQSVAGGYELITASIPVNFVYLTANGVTNSGSTPIGTPIQATLTMTGLTSSPVQSLGGGFFLSEAFQSVSMQFTANSPIGPFSQTNLLTLSGANGTMAGLTGGSAPTLEGSTQAGNTVQFASDFMSFNNVVNEDYSLSFSSLTSAGGGLTLGPDGYFDPFTASGVGTFASDPPPIPTLPEPGTVAFAVSMGASGLYGLRRKLKLKQ